MAIKKEELRAGNLVKCGDKIVTVEEIGHDGINLVWMHEMTHWDYDYGQLDPIDLSEHWLEILGFVKEESNDVQEREIWSIQVANQVSLYYDKGYDEDRPWYISSFDNNNHYQHDFWNQPKHIHTLQNLFHSLSGEELTLKETINDNKKAI